MTKTLSIAVLLSGLTLASCRSEIDDKNKASVGQATDISLSTTGLKEVPFAKNSKLEWVGAKVTGDHTGGLKDWNGKAFYNDKGELKAVRVELDLTSLFADQDKLTQHLKSGDFFDVAQFPKGVFVADSFEPKADGKFTHVAKGKLNLRGITKEISFPLTISKKGKVHNAKSEFTIKRFDFNINYKGKADDLIKDEVLVRFDVSANSPS